MTRTAVAAHPSAARRRPSARWRGLVALAAAVALLAAGCSGGSDPSAGAASGSTTTTSVAPSITATAPGPATSVASSTTSTSPAAPGASAAVAAEGTYPVGFVQVDLTDDSRDTPANGSAPGSDGRKLPTLAYYPAKGPAGPDAGGADAAVEGGELREGRFPLLVFSHGVTGRAVFYKGELAAMASAGYVVIAPDYPLSNADSREKPTVNDVGNQPGDASFLIDQFTEAPYGSPTVDVAAHVDAEHVGAVGHSLGAITSLGLGYSACCTDDRVDAVASWAGLLVPLQGQPNPGDQTGDRPLLLIHGDQDETVPYGSSTEAFEKVTSPRWFITLPGGRHIPPYLSPTVNSAARLVTTTTIDFFDAQLKGDPGGIERMDQAVAGAGPQVATIQHAG